MANEFGEIFEVELKCWCIGLTRVSGRVDRSVLHQVIKEFAPVLREAVEHSYECDILGTAKRLITSGRCQVSEKEIAFYILSYLPTPAELSQTQVDVLKRIVDQVEKKYGGAFKRLEKKWKALEELSGQERFNAPASLESLSFPPKPASAS